MDIDRVRYFCVFANSGSLVKASEILKISQPALSKALKVLESEVGQKLTERQGRGLILTDHGNRFFRDVGPLLESWLNVGKQLQQPLKQMPFRIGSFEVFTTYFLSKFLTALPTSGVDIIEYLPGQLEDAIADHRVDVGITYVPIPKPRVVFKEAAQITMGVFGSKRKQTLNNEMPFVVPIAPLEGTPSKVVGLDGWPDHEYPRTFGYRVSLMQSALEICRQGLAVAYLPEFIVKLYNATVEDKFRLVPYPCPISRLKRSQSVYIIQRQGDQEGPEVRAIARALRELRTL